MLTDVGTFVIIFLVEAIKCPQNAAVAQSVERHIGNVEVTGSIPVSSSLKQNPM